MLTGKDRELTVSLINGEDMVLQWPCSRTAIRSVEIQSFDLDECLSRNIWTTADWSNARSEGEREETPLVDSLRHGSGGGKDRNR